MHDIAAPRRDLLWSLLTSVRASRLDEERMARDNPHLRQALAADKHSGLAIAVRARTIALLVIGALLPLLNPTWSVLYHEALLVAFMAIGWLQMRAGRVGRSGLELALIFADLALLSFTVLVPNPWFHEPMPTAFQYRFENFIYFFVLLAGGTLAYSWRTVLAIGTWTAGLWLGGLALVHWFGRRIPELSPTVESVFTDWPTIAEFLDPNATLAPLRVQEVVVFLIVAGILALQGFRTRQLVIRQAQIAAERANLSRYFPQNLVDVLAAADHDVGAERSQEIAVLFADIVGFTEIAERHPPAKVMQLLRRYHAVLEDVVFAHHGTLDKYLGDGIMATFGTPAAGPRDAANALAAARAIVAAMDDCSAECAARGDPRFRVSVGVHFGPVILGDIGPARRLEFAVVGDTVNVAARLEAATRALRCRLVVSDALVAKLGEAGSADPALLDGLRRRRRLRLRGRQTPIDVWLA
ncbi:MAG: adenylate cyclase [Alphaproteobacteria bacterium]|nr:MAG: adenylate cyclase [Alphaproteobacteria bacterium]